MAYGTVYDDWGIGKGGTQTIALAVDRKFFRETTRGAMAIVDRITLADFPGGKPLPNQVNVVLTQQDINIGGVVICHSPQDAVALAKTAKRTMVISGGSIYRQMLPYCHTAYITKVHTQPKSDTFSPNLDQGPQWTLSQVLMYGEKMGFPTKCVCTKESIAAHCDVFLRYNKPCTYNSPESR